MRMERAGRAAEEAYRRQARGRTDVVGREALKMNKMSRTARKNRKKVLAVICASYLTSCGSPHRDLTKKISCEIARMMVVRKIQSGFTSPTILYSGSA